MPIVTQLFQIQHLPLSIDDPQELLGSTANQMLPMFRREGVALRELPPGCMRLTVHQDRRADAQHEPLPRVWQGCLDGVQFAVYRRGPRRRIELPGRAVADFDVDRGWAELCLSTPDDAAARWFLLLRIVCDALTRGGYSFLHAACLAVQRRGQWRGVVVSAPSNTGKTTTALSLANSGWRILGDDIAYVRPPHLGSTVWGFPRACHIRPGAFAMLPWLNQLELTRPDKEGVRRVSMANLAPRSWVGAPWLQPALVVVLDRPNAKVTRVERIDRAEALSQLGGESINAIPGVCDDDAARDFVTVGRLVCTAPACRVSVGPNVTDVAAKLELYLDACDAAGEPRTVRVQKRAA
jgi:hypothetical protein